MALASLRTGAVYAIRHFVAHLAEESVLQLHDLFFRAENLRLIFFQGGGDVALGVGRGLLAVVIGGDGDVAAGFGDFNVVAEDVVEADLEVLDPRPLPLRLFDLGDERLAAGAQFPQGVQFGMVAVLDQAALAQQHRRLVHDGRFQKFGQFRRHVGEGGAQGAERAALRGAAQGGVHVRQGE